MTPNPKTWAEQSLQPGGVAFPAGGADFPAEPAEPSERVPWPRFDVVETRFTGEGRARYCIVDHLNRTHRFPVNPFSKEEAYGLAALHRKNAIDKGEPITVLRDKGAVSPPPQVRRERPSLPPQKNPLPAEPAPPKGGAT